MFHHGFNRGLLKLCHWLLDFWGNTGKILIGFDGIKATVNPRIGHNWMVDKPSRQGWLTIVLNSIGLTIMYIDEEWFIIDV